MSAIILLVLRILMAAALYGFLGLAIYSLLKDIRQQGQLLVARQPVPLTLTRPAEIGAVPMHYTRPEITLGRETGCDFQLEDPTVSAQHARLTYHHQQWWLEDLASTNGTYLNDEVVTAPVVITSGDELRLGHLVVKVHVGAGEPKLS